MRRVSFRRVGAAVCAAACVLAGVAAGPGAGAVRAAPARASLPDLERQVMCVACGVPLNIAEDSQQADRERALIRSLIDEGLTAAQIKRALVAQYGARVLATPTHSGFGLAAYLVPVAVALGALALLALLLPRWRRRGGSPQGSGPAGVGAGGTPPVSPSEAARLDADLASFDG